MDLAAENLTKTEIVTANENFRQDVDPRILNLAHLAQYTCENKDLERELLGLFKDQAGAQFENIQSANNEDDWEMAVHTLKGSARSIGASELAVLSKNLETVGFNGPEAEKQQVVNQLKQAVAACLDTIERLL